jgi:hypothetical protein
MAKNRQKKGIGICPNCRRRLVKKENHCIGTVGSKQIFSCEIEMEVNEYE